MLRYEQLEQPCRPRRMRAFRCRLFAGGKWIRTISTRKRSYRFETDFCRLHNGSRSRDSFLSRRRTDRSTKRPRPLEAENAKLKRLLADAMLDNTALKDLFGKMVTPVVPGSNLVSVRAIRGSSFGQ